jgi:exopolysaccharide production protein ExoQ
MSHQLATVVFALGILGLFLLDRNPRVRTSAALWIAVAWLLIAGSRNVGEWLSLGQPMESDSAYLEGNPVDRAVLGGLLAAGLVVLVGRRNKTAALLRANGPIVGYFLYCGLSSLWSDYTDVSFKRWVRALGDIVVVLLVLTDADWLNAFKRLITRAGFVLIPVSLLFILHYPELGRVYGRWDGKMVWTGVTTGKNTLGMICLIFGLASVWRLLEWYRTEKRDRRTGSLIAHGVFLAMTLLVLLKANSMTSIACFFLASAVMVGASWRGLARRPAMVHWLVGSLVFGAFCVLFLGIGTGLLQDVGRDSTLTGRTDVWKVAIKLCGNPLVGTGYESFWLGSRLATMRDTFEQHVNQVHNGYLEVYLNLGWVGILLLGTILVTGYRRIVAWVFRGDLTGCVMLAYFVAAVVYDFTEGGFKMMYPVWIFFLMANVAVSARQFAKVRPPVQKVRSYPTWADMQAAATDVSMEEV